MILSRREKRYLDKIFGNIACSDFGSLITIERIERLFDDDDNEIDKKIFSKTIYAKLINKEIKEWDMVVGQMVVKGDLMVIIRDSDRYYYNKDLLANV